MSDFLCPDSDVRQGSPTSDGIAVAGNDSLGAGGQGSNQDSPMLCNSLLQSMHSEKLVAVCHLVASPHAAGREGRDTNTGFLVPTYMVDSKFQVGVPHHILHSGTAQRSTQEVTQCSQDHTKDNIALSRTLSWPSL